MERLEEFIKRLEMKREKAGFGKNKRWFFFELKRFLRKNHK